MTKYIIEGGINFYEELYKSFDEPDITTDNICQITGMPLTDRCITLECNHKFNYSALYKEIYKQKYIFRTYNIDTLTSSELIKFNDANKDYFIKCPYCRCIQFTLLPHYEDMEHETKYGINSLIKDPSDYNFLIKAKSTNFNYMAYGYTFNSGNCCKVILTVDGIDIFCKSKMSSPVLEMNKSFCYLHIRGEIKKYKQEKLIQLKEDLRLQKMKDKEELKLQKIKDKEELKLQKMKDKDKNNKNNNKVKKTVNVVSGQSEIQIYNPDNNDNDNNDNDNDNDQIVGGIDINVCQIILKSGTKKGQICGNKAKDNNCCLRHSKINIIL